MKVYKWIIWLRNVFLLKFFFPIIYSFPSGVKILEEDWKYLIILDACRYDYFKKAIKKVGIKGRLEKRISLASETTEFLKRNFKDYQDIIYITANPFVNKFLDGKFFKIVSVWKFRWDYKEKTVLPSSMVDEAIKVVKEFPDKRVIIHFIQPHYPFIGYKSRDTSLEDLRTEVIKGVKFRGNIAISKIHEFYSIPIYMEFDVKMLKKMYMNNLMLVLKEVKRLIKYLNGKIVITADHGEAFGERIGIIKIYGHPKSVRIKPLILVPWFVVQNLNIERK